MTIGTIFTSFSLMLGIVTSLLTVHQQYRLGNHSIRLLPRRVQQVQRRRSQLQQQEGRLYRT
jgi:hypothetical protein